MSEMELHNDDRQFGLPKTGLGFAFEGIEVSCVKLKYLKMPGFYFYLIFYFLYIFFGQD